MSNELYKFLLPETIKVIEESKLFRNRINKKRIEILARMEASVKKIEEEFKKRREQDV